MQNHFYFIFQQGNIGHALALTNELLSLGML